MTCPPPGDAHAQGRSSYEKSKQFVTKHKYWSSAGYLLDTLLGSLEYRRRCRKHRGKPREEINARYQSPSWLARRAWEMTVYQERFSWQVALQTYRTVPTGASMFKAAIRGNLEWMRQLLSNHDGYVNDRDLCGNTPLHVSI
jgi:hypothetical protein